ncbi:putative transmembrane protein [Gregarina niphandrodes]|uniref:Transmembrane protein n=1 Tax=Gregarina niphandrodes TaxID=110365 RepID=A0A023B1J9_GRENI|nr:putative transmembrane protein [Gregarina niphandrodes]EZG47894.1 putative transmembrane protein [Gregarina niphandrodes]|eukprot:XP_011132138.1 putative transmembrane protein [Gregarina niphandrodes]
MGLSDIPANNDYREWGQLLASKASKACGEANVLKTAKYSMGIDVFNGLRHDKSVEKMVGWLTSVSSRTSYLNTRWYSIFLLVVCVCILIYCVVVACAVSSKVRTAYSKAFCGLFGDVGQRPRLTQIRRGTRLRLVSFAFLGLVILAVSGAFGFKASHQVMDSQRVVNCNLWAQLNGHFNGALNLDAGDIREISNNWLGTLPIRDLLTSLDGKTVGGPENSIYLKLSAGRDQLKANLTEAQEVMTLALEKAGNLTADWSTEITKQSTALKKLDAFGPNKRVGNRKTFDMTLGIQQVFEAKHDAFITQLDEALTQTWNVTESLINKYAGTGSALMSKANRAVQSTKTTVNQIDRAFAKMVTMWNKYNGKVKALMQAGAVLAALGIAFGLTGALIAVLASWKLGHDIKKNIMPKRSAVIAWKVAYVFTVIAAGISAIALGIEFLTAVIGRDACDTASNELLTEGNWGLLPKEMLHPVPDDEEVYMPLVYDVCVKRGGYGTIGMSLGLDEPIATLTEDVDVALADIDGQREGLLERNRRYVQIHSIGIMLREMLRGFVPKKAYEAADRNVMPIRTFDKLASVTLEGHQSDTQGLRYMLGIIPYWTDPAVLVVGAMPWGQNLASLEDAYNLLNDLSDKAMAANSKSPMPRFCGQFARSHNMTCSTLPDDDGTGRVVVDLANLETNADNTLAWVQQLDTDVPVYNGHYGNTTQRSWNTLESTRFMEILAASTPITEAILNRTCDAPEPNAYPTHGYTFNPRNKGRRQLEAEDDVSTDDDDTPSCTVGQVRDVDLVNFENYFNSFYASYNGVVANVDEYVDGLVKPSVTELVDEANSILTRTNCQFEGTTLDKAVVDPMCNSLFPGSTVLSIILTITTVVLGLLAAHIWHWTHYVIDIVNDYEKNPSSFEQLASMKNRPDYISYSGMPSVNQPNAEKQAENQQVVNQRAPPVATPTNLGPERQDVLQDDLAPVVTELEGSHTASPRSSAEGSPVMRKAVYNGASELEPARNGTYNAPHPVAEDSFVTIEGYE